MAAIAIIALTVAQVHYMRMLDLEEDCWREEAEND